MAIGWIVERWMHNYLTFLRHAVRRNNGPEQERKGTGAAKQERSLSCL